MWIYKLTGVDAQRRALLSTLSEFKFWRPSSAHLKNRLEFSPCIQTAIAIENPELRLEDAERDRLVDRHGRTNPHPNRVEGTDQENRGRQRTTERVLELVDGFQKRNGDQTNRDGSHGQNAQQFVRDDSQRVESREKVPLRQDFQRSGEWIRRLTQLSRFHNRQGDGQRDGTQDDDRENVQQIVRPRRFTVVVVTHTLRELGSQHRVGQVRLLGDGVGDDQGARLGGFDAAMMMTIQTEKYKRSVSDRTNDERERERKRSRERENAALKENSERKISIAVFPSLPSPLSRSDDDGFISFSYSNQKYNCMFSSLSRTRFEANRITVRDNADRCARFDDIIPRSVPRNLSREDFPCARLGLHFSALPFAEI